LHRRAAGGSIEYFSILQDWRASMKRMTVRLALAAGMLALGWAAGRAQPAQPDFEIVVDAPGGATSITCVRGCGLAWVERGVNPNTLPMTTFSYNCTAARCSSAKVGGWIKQ
jgi:hypothetical protein